MHGQDLRELRVQFGWRILSGVTVRSIAREEDVELPEFDLHGLKPDDYVLADAEQDRGAAFRWNLANSIRKEKGGVRDKILAYMRANVSSKITGEELAYIAGDVQEWPRRVRELRIDFGWPISTKNSGRPDLPIGVYVLEEDRQAPEHDRVIPDAVRREVLRRDGYACRLCGWNHDLWNASDPRHLEVHHVQYHARGGHNEEENLVTLCQICHDEVHAGRSRVP